MRDDLKRDISAGNFALSYKSLFHRVTGTLLSLNFGFLGSGVMNKGSICLGLPQGALLYLRLMAPGMVQLCVLSTPMLHLIGANPPQNKFMEKTPLKQR